MLHPGARQVLRLGRRFPFRGSGFISSSGLVMNSCADLRAAKVLTVTGDSCTDAPSLSGTSTLSTGASDALFASTAMNELSTVSLHLLWRQSYPVGEENPD